MKKLGIAIGTFIGVVIVGVVFLYPRLREWRLLNEQHDLRIAIAQKAYLDQAVRSATNQSEVQASVVVGSSIFGEILSGLKGLKVNLPSAGNATIEFIDSHVDFQDGFPIVTFSARATRPDIPNTAVKATITATLAPTTSPDQSSEEVEFRIRLIDIKPKFSWASLSLEVPGFLRILATVKLTEVEEVLPVLELPIEKRLSFQLPSQAIPTRIPTDNGWIDATARTPPVTVHWSVALQRLLFLSDGVHVGLNLDAPASSIGMPAYSLDVPGDERRIEARLSEERRQIALLRTVLEAKFGNEKRSGSDLSLHASPALFTAAVSGLNSVSPPLDINLTDIAEHGYIKQGGGSTGYYVELSGRNSLQATTVIRNFRASWIGPGKVGITTDFVLSASAQIAYHIKAPVGEGIGGVVGAVANKQGTIAATAIFTTDGKKWPDYTIQLTGPPTVEITLSGQIRHIGEIGIPVKINLPVGTIVRGSAPSFFAESGSIKIPMPDGSSQERVYKLSVEPQSSTIDQSGFSTDDRLRIDWQR